MASVIVKRIGASDQTTEAATVGEIKTKLNLSNYTADVKSPMNGESDYTVRGDNYELEDGDIVRLAQNTKGGKI